MRLQDGNIRFGGTYISILFYFILTHFVYPVSFWFFMSPEKVKFFRRVIFNFICGNEDMHLKNYSLIALPKKGIRLAPAYDFLNSTMTYMSLDRPLQKIEESALPLKGKKRKLTRRLWLDYYAIEKLQLLVDDAVKIIDELKFFFASSDQMIDSSFLNEQEKMLYKEIIRLRLLVL